MSGGEIINPAAKIRTVFINDEIVRVPIEVCDNCEEWKDAHAGSYTRGIGGEKILWLCGECK